MAAQGIGVRGHIEWRAGEPKESDDTRPGRLDAKEGGKREGGCDAASFTEASAPFSTIGTSERRGTVCRLLMLLGNGRHDWIRTNDLFRVKEAL